MSVFLGGQSGVDAAVDNALERNWYNTDLIERSPRIWKNLMQLSMQLNQVKFKLDNVIVDEFVDASGVESALLYKTSTGAYKFTQTINPSISSVETVEVTESDRGALDASHVYEQTFTPLVDIMIGTIRYLAVGNSHISGGGVNKTYIYEINGSSATLIAESCTGDGAECTVDFEPNLIFKKGRKYKLRLQPVREYGFQAYAKPFILKKDLGIIKYEGFRDVTTGQGLGYDLYFNFASAVINGTMDIATIKTVKTPAQNFNSLLLLSTYDNTSTNSNAVKLTTEFYLIDGGSKRKITPDSLLKMEKISNSIQIEIRTSRTIFDITSAASMTVSSSIYSYAIAHDNKEEA